MEKKIRFLDKLLDKDELLKELDDITFSTLRKVKFKEVILEPNGVESLRPFFASVDQFKQLLDVTGGVKFKVKEIVIDDHTDTLEAIKKLRLNNKTIVEKIITDLNEKFEIEKERVSNCVLYLNGVKEYISANNLAEFELVSEARSTWFIKTFKTPLVVKDGFRDNGKITNKDYKRTQYIFSEPICKIKKIGINILHTSIGDSSIKLLIDGAHPNVNKLNHQTDRLTNPCIGELKGIKIDISNPVYLINLIDDIAKTYSHVHMDSTWWDPVEVGWNGKKFNISETKDQTKSIWN